MINLFMTKELRKQHMIRTRLLNRFRKERNPLNELAYKQQKNYCVFLLRETKRAYYQNLKPSSISNKLLFWKVTKPLCSDKLVSNNNITLIERNEIISDDDKIASIFSSFFSKAVRGLNLEYYEHFSWDRYFVCNTEENEDPILRAIEKYQEHPSIMKIREFHARGEKFSFKPVDLNTGDGYKDNNKSQITSRISS